MCVLMEVEGMEWDGMQMRIHQSRSLPMCPSTSMWLYSIRFDSIRFDFTDKCCTPISVLGRLFLTGMEIGGGRSEATTAHSVGSVPSPSGSLSLVRLV